jgi:hypothetical protein
MLTIDFMRAISGVDTGGRLVEAITFKVSRELKLSLESEGITGEVGAALVRDYLRRLVIKRQKRRLALD